ncbi:MAG: MucB/RseB C-terminal domain-containing protein [Gammaproteobacteria bacterium]
MLAVKDFNFLLATWLFLVTGALAHAAEQGNDPASYIDAMVKAMHSLNYQGTVVLYKNGELDTIKFSHIVNPRGDAQEHAVALNSPLREIIRNADKVLCIYPEARALIVDHLPLHRSFLIDFPAIPETLQANYFFMLAGEETVALHPAVIVVIKPKDQYRYARRIWIGKENHLPLKYEMLNKQGKVLEQMAFTDLTVNPSLAASFTELETYQNPDLNTQHIHRLQQLPIEQAGFTLQNIPGGFKPFFFTRRKMHGRDELVEHLLLKDGLASVSVYVEKHPTPFTASAKAAGAINFYSRQIGAYQITVVGDVPADTVRFVAEGVELREPHD